MCDRPEAERFAFTCPGYSDKDPLPAALQQEAEQQGAGAGGEEGAPAEGEGDEGAAFEEEEQAAEQTL